MPSISRAQSHLKSHLQMDQEKMARGKIEEERRGYRCEFMDSVPGDFYCKKCELVARELVFTQCCEESYCRACLAASIQQPQNDRCPSCGRAGLETLTLTKYHRRILGYRVYCTMKDRGCPWSGTLQELEPHLDPVLGSCQHVHTKCPSCEQFVPKNKLDQHSSSECSMRPHFCQHCSYKASYREIVEHHLPECKYVPVQCPNLCGVSCDREMIEDHMRICRLDEVECEFRDVGCDERLKREDLERHARENSLKHIVLTAKVVKELKGKLCENEEGIREQKDKLIAHEVAMAEECQRVENLDAKFERGGLDLKIQSQTQQHLQMHRELEGKLKSVEVSLQEQKLATDRLQARVSRIEQDNKVHNKPLLDKVPEFEKKICLQETLMQEQDRKLEELGKKLEKDFQQKLNLQSDRYLKQLQENVEELSQKIQEVQEKHEIEKKALEMKVQQQADERDRLRQDMRELERRLEALPPPPPHWPGPPPHHRHHHPPHHHRLPLPYRY